MNRQRVFISGGAGVIGHALVSLLLKEGADIFVGDLKPCPIEWQGKLKYRQGDLNTLTIEEMLAFDPEIFFHLAATFERSEETYPFFNENYHHNVKLSHHLLNSLKRSNRLKKVVFASSYLIYDPTLYQFQEPQETIISLSETDSVYPRNICGAAKFFHELELRFFEPFFDKKVSFSSARIFRVYGRGSRDIISRWIRAALKGETLAVYCPQGRFDYIFADDVAEGLWRLSQTTFNGVVNLGSGQSRSIYDVIQVLKANFADLRTEEHSESILFEASQANMRLFEEATGWKPSCLLEQGIPALIQFEKEQMLKKSQEDECFKGVLITSISKKVPLIQAVRKAGQAVGQFSTVYGCDTDQECMGRYWVDAFWNCPLLKELSKEQLLEYLRAHSIRALIPTRDGELSFFAQHKKWFASQGIHIMISDEQTIERCLDKQVFADFLSSRGFPTIPTVNDPKKLQTASYTVKERYGAGAHKIGLDLSQEQAVQHGRELEQPIFQPFIKGKEWSIDLYRSVEGELQGCVARTRDKVIQGESQITTTVSFPALEELCKKMADALQIKGHAIFQVFEDEEGSFQVIECNPRFGGASTASLAVGLDSFYWFFLECSGQDLKGHPFKRSQDIRQIRYPADRIIPWS